MTNQLLTQWLQLIFKYVHHLNPETWLQLRSHPFSFTLPIECLKNVLCFFNLFSLVS